MLPQQRVPGPEVVDQHTGRGAGRGRERLEAVGQPVRERVVDAGVENPLAAFEGRGLPHVPEIAEGQLKRKKRFLFF